MKRSSKAFIVGILLLFICNPIIQVRAANDWVGVSDTLPQISYYYYTIEVKNASTTRKYSVTMSVRNITTLSDKSIIYVLFETDYTTDPVFVKEIQIQHSTPSSIDTSNQISFGLAMMFISAFILSFMSGWIINKATPQKELTYTNGNTQISFKYDNNGVLQNFLFKPDADNSIEIKRLIEPLYIYGAGLLIGLIFIIIIVVCAKRK